MDFNPASPPEASTPDWFGHGPLGRAERRLAGLEHLAGVAIRLADAFAVQAFTAANTAWITPDSHIDPGIPYARMVQVVRQTMALQVRFEKEDRLAAAAETARRDPDRRAPQTRRRRLITDAITAAIKDTADPSDTEHLLRDLKERLHDIEADECFDEGPIGEVVAKICEALGVSIDLSLFDDEAARTGTIDRPPPRRPTEPATSAPPSRPPNPRPPGADPLAALHGPGITPPGDPRPMRENPAAKITPSPD